MFGFSDYRREPRSHIADVHGLMPLGADTLIMQVLPASRLTSGQEYLIWFQFYDAEPVTFSFTYTFAAARSNIFDTAVSSLRLNHTG
jgi:hypothetical protein